MTSGSIGQSGTQSSPPQVGVSTTSQITELYTNELAPLVAELHELQEMQHEFHHEIQTIKVSARSRLRSRDLVWHLSVYDG